jgi:hypothetical protein
MVFVGVWKGRATDCDEFWKSWHAFNREVEGYGTDTCDGI